MWHSIKSAGYERLWFIGVVCMQIISAGELSSMDQCWSVFAAAAASPITDWLVMLASDELNLTMTIKAEFKHNGQTSDTVQRDYWHNSHKIQTC